MSDFSSSEYIKAECVYKDTSGRVDQMRGVMNARNIRLLLELLALSARLLVLAYFYKCSHARFSVKIVFGKVLVARKANFYQ